MFLAVTKDSVTAAAEPLRSAALPAEEENAVLSVPSSVDF